MIKKIICIMIMLIFVGGILNGKVLAKEGREDFLIKKEKDEVNKNIGILQSRYEKWLNRNGIFDEEIKKYSENEIKEIEKMNIDDSIISTAYYVVDDSTEEKDNKCFDEGDMIQLTSEETNKYIAQKYYGENTDIYETLNNKFNREKKRNVFFSLGCKLGIFPVNIQAETLSKGGKDDSKHPTMLKKIIIVSKKKKRNIKVIAKYWWTEMPKYRELDAISLKWDNARYQVEDASATHTWGYEYYTMKSGRKSNYKKEPSVSKKMKMKANPNTLKDNQFFACNGFICAASELHMDKRQTINSHWYNYTRYYNEIVSFELTLKRIKGTKFVKFYPYYDHTKTKYDLLSVAISIAEGGKMSAVYSLLNGDVKKVEHEYSGVNDYFKFSF